VPFSSFPRERLVLLLIAITALAVNVGTNAEDTSRLALTEALVLDGSLQIDDRADETIDKAFYGGHWYTDKAPGISLLAVPSFAVMHGLESATSSEGDVFSRRSHLWVVRIFTGGVLFLLGVLAVGRASEGLAQGTGAAAAVVFGLGTLAHPLAVTTYGHVGGGVLSLLAFLLAWTAVHGPRGRPGLLVSAGLLAGLAVLFEYPAGMIGLAILVYVLSLAGASAALAFGLGAAGPLLGLGVYNGIAFGSPFHLSYRYVSEQFVEKQSQGFFGVSAPDWAGARDVLFSEYGLLVLSPVLALATAGLVLMWRHGHRAEAAVCGVVTSLFLVLNMGYWDRPYGGGPGPRFLAACLPLLVLGLAFAFERWPRLTASIGGASVLLTTWNSLTWAFNSHQWPFSTGFHPENPPSTIWSGLGLPPYAGFAPVFASALAAIAVAATELLRSRRAGEVFQAAPRPSAG